ncbi:hypothetical protein B0H14DRAFT_2626227 [Mycena olivaceomarginata]|nr:hypothetical protein B0H14DRAFT_2626227 [Mycena olivaceomarginata]
MHEGMAPTAPTVRAPIRGCSMSDVRMRAGLDVVDTSRNWFEAGTERLLASCTASCGLADHGAACCTLPRDTPRVMWASACSPYSRNTLARSRTRRTLRTPPAASAEVVWISISTPPCTSGPTLCFNLQRRYRHTRPLCRTALGPSADAEGRAATTLNVFNVPHTSSSAPCVVVREPTHWSLAVLLWCTRTRVLYPIRVHFATALGLRLQRCVNMSPPLTAAEPARASHECCTLVPPRVTGHPTVHVVPLHVSISPPRCDLMVNVSSLAAHAAHAVSQAPHIRCVPAYLARGGPRRVDETMLRHRCLAVAKCFAPKAPDTQRTHALPVSARLHHLQLVKTLTCPRSLALPMRMLPLLPSRMHLLTLLRSPGHIAFWGAYLPCISSTVSHISFPSVFCPHPFCKFVLRAPLVVSINPFSTLATWNHPATLLTTSNYRSPIWPICNEIIENHYHHHHQQRNKQDFFIAKLQVLQPD